MSARGPKGTDTAIVKAMAKTIANRRNGRHRAADVQRLMGERKEAARLGKTGLMASELASFTYWRKTQRHKARLLRRASKKAGQPFRKNMDRKRMRRRAAGKNEVTR